jgi:hypothetical protein
LVVASTSCAVVRSTLSVSQALVSVELVVVLTSSGNASQLNTRLSSTSYASAGASITQLVGSNAVCGGGSVASRNEGAVHNSDGGGVGEVESGGEKLSVTLASCSESDSAAGEASCGCSINGEERVGNALRSSVRRGREVGDTASRVHSGATSVQNRSVLKSTCASGESSLAVECCEGILACLTGGTSESGESTSITGLSRSINCCEVCCVENCIGQTCCAEQSSSLC